MLRGNKDSEWALLCKFPKAEEIKMTPQIAMAVNFYYLSEQPSGLWAVKETVSQQAVSLNGQLCCSLKKRDAEELIDYLNNLDASLAA